MPAGGEPAATPAPFCLRRLRNARTPPITNAVAPAPINTPAQPGSPLDSAELSFAAAAPAAAATPGWPAAAVEVVAAGVVTVDVRTTVVVCAGSVTVLVLVGAVTVLVLVGPVTVTVFAGAVTVSVRVAVVASAIVAVLVLGVVAACEEVEFPPGVPPWRFVSGRVTVPAAPAPAVPVLVSVRLPVAAVPEPHPAKAGARIPRSAAAAHRLARPAIQPRMTTQPCYSSPD